MLNVSFCLSKEKLTYILWGKKEPFDTTWELYIHFMENEDMSEALRGRGWVAFFIYSFIYFKKYIYFVFFCCISSATSITLLHLSSFNKVRFRTMFDLPFVSKHLQQFEIYILLMQINNVHFIVRASVREILRHLISECIVVFLTVLFQITTSCGSPSKTEWIMCQKIMHTTRGNTQTHDYYEWKDMNVVFRIFSVELAFCNLAFKLSFFKKTLAMCLLF